MLEDDEIKQDIDKIIAKVYNTKYYGYGVRIIYLKNYRNQVIASFILHTHLSIEYYLKELILKRMRKIKSLKISEFKKKLNDMRSLEVLNYAKVLGLISSDLYQDLVVLNTLRNKCAHSRFLNEVKYIKSKFNPGKWEKTPAITFKQKNIFETDVFLNEFFPLYSEIQDKLFFYNINFHIYNDKAPRQPKR